MTFSDSKNHFEEKTVGQLVCRPPCFHYVCCYTSRRCILYNNFNTLKLSIIHCTDKVVRQWWECVEEALH